MSELTDCKQSADSASRKRCPSPDHDEGSTIPSKSTKVSDESNEATESCKNSEAESKAVSEEGQVKEAAVVQTEPGSDSQQLPVNNSKTDGHDGSNTEKPHSSGAQRSADAKKTAGTKPVPQLPWTSPTQRP